MYLVILWDPQTKTFAAAIQFAAGVEPAYGAAGDFDEDGDQDVIVTNATADGVMVLWNETNEQSGQSVFLQRFTSVGAANFDDAVPKAVTVADLDEDGKLDVLVANGEANSVVRCNLAGVRTITIVESETVVGVDFSGVQANASHPWQNPIQACDVNNDGSVTPEDVILLINGINANGEQALPVPASPSRRHISIRRATTDWSPSTS